MNCWNEPWGWTTLAGGLVDEMLTGGVYANEYINSKYITQSIS
jgi:hypothetical protein